MTALVLLGRPIAVRLPLALLWSLRQTPPLAVEGTVDPVDPDETVDPEEAEDGDEHGMDSSG